MFAFKQNYNKNSELLTFKVPRKSVTISKTSENKIKSFLKKFGEFTNDKFDKEFTRLVEYDIKNIKECSDKSIVDLYIDTATEKLNNGDIIDKDFYKDLTSRTRKKLVSKYASNKSYDNNIDIYFNEVKNVYIEHPQNECNDLEFNDANKEIFIKNNLKLVIECAKRYQNLGLPFEDLIQFGNIGLLVALDKFDPNRANLRHAIIDDIEYSELESFDYENAESIIKKNFTYSKNLDMTLDKIPKDGFESKDEFIDWAKEHIKGAVFASVAFQWIRAHILMGINKHGKVIEVPPSVKKELGSSTIIRLDSINPHTDDCYHDNEMSEYINNEISIEQELFEDEEHNERVKEIVDELLVNLNGTDRRIIRKKFGIGYPFPMSVTDIASSENLPINKVKYSISNGMKILQEKAKDSKFVNEIFY